MIVVFIFVPANPSTVVDFTFNSIFRTTFGPWYETHYSVQSKLSMYWIDKVYNTMLSLSSKTYKDVSYTFHHGLLRRERSKSSLNRVSKAMFTIIYIQSTPSF